MPTRLPLLLSIFLFLFSITVAAQKITADYDGHVDFKKYTTYAWMAPGDSVFNRYRTDKVFAGYITYMANIELKNRGFKPDTLHPQAVFVFDTMVENFKQYTQGATLSVGVGVAGPGYYMGGSAPVAGGKITESTIHNGSYVIAMYDAESKRLIWRATASKEFKMTDDIQKLLGESTKKMFKKLPIKNKK